jgi:DNA replication protein DnaC
VWNVNYFYNRTKDQNNNVPLFTYDENEIQKHINQQAVSFYGKRTLERLRGMEFLINFKSKDTRHKKMFRLGFTKENLYLE